MKTDELKKRSGRTKEMKASLIKDTTFKQLMIGISELNLFDVPLLDTFKNKKFAIYTLKTLLGIVVDNPDDLEIQTESFIQHPENKRGQRMDVRMREKYQH